MQWIIVCAHQEAFRAYGPWAHTVGKNTQVYGGQGIGVDSTANRDNVLTETLGLVFFG